MKVKQKDLVQGLQGAKGVVGESARSRYECAKEHRQDAAEQSEDNHMIKHWKLSHPELPEPHSSTFKW